MFTFAIFIETSRVMLRELYELGVRTDIANSSLHLSSSRSEEAHQGGKICFPQLFVDVAARLPFRSADFCQRAEEIPYLGSKSGCVFLCQQSRRCCLVLLLRGKDCSAALASEKCVEASKRKTKAFLFDEFD